MPKPPPKPPNPHKPVVGKLVSAGTGTLTLKHGKDFLTVSVAPTAAVTIDGQPGNFADLKQGMQVRCLMQAAVAVIVNAYSKDDGTD